MSISQILICLSPFLKIVICRMPLSRNVSSKKLIFVLREITHLILLKTKSKGQKFHMLHWRDCWKNLIWILNKTFIWTVDKRRLERFFFTYIDKKGMQNCIPFSTKSKYIILLLYPLWISNFFINYRLILNFEVTGSCTYKLRV
ncbi:hypothetical protein D3C85_237890 [compost metagenome]